MQAVRSGAAGRTPTFSSTTPGLAVDVAAIVPDDEGRNFQAIERRRGDRAPDGPTLKAYKRRLWEDDIARFAQEHELCAEQEGLWAAELAGDDVAKQQLLDDLDRRMRTAGWRSPPAIRAKRRLNRRGDKHDPAEGERAKERLRAKVARWLAIRFAPGAVAAFWAAMQGPDAQEYFDKTVAAYRASGWQDDGGYGRGLSRATHQALWTGTPSRVPEMQSPAPTMPPPAPPPAAVVMARSDWHHGGGSYVAERERRRAEERAQRQQYIYGGLS
jgi:hypothetical protein